MSLRIDTVDLYPGSLVIGNTGLGVVANTVPSTGQDGDAAIYRDLSPADMSKEVYAKITRWPSTGTLFMYEDTSFIMSSAGTFDYELFVDGVSVGTSTTSATAANGSVTLSSAASTQTNTAALVVLGQAVTLTSGASSSANLSSAVVLTSTHTLFSASCVSASASDSGSLSYIVNLYTPPSTSTNFSDAGDVSQIYMLASSVCTQANRASFTMLNPSSILVPYINYIRAINGKFTVVKPTVLVGAYLKA